MFPFMYTAQHSSSHCGTNASGSDILLIAATAISAFYLLVTFMCWRMSITDYEYGDRKNDSNRTLLRYIFKVQLPIFWDVIKHLV
jgi:hypothetical protein